MAAALPVAAVFLRDGGQTAEGIAEVVTEFLRAARKSLEIAIYDLRLEGVAADTLLRAIGAASSRGVSVRVIFNVEHRKPVPVPPPSMVDWSLVRAFGVPFHPINGVPDLMHHKYVVRDSGGPTAAVLTGSTNWTTDSWTREENVLVRVDSAELAADYLDNFEELWSKRQVSDSGHLVPHWTEPPVAGGLRIRPYFCPGHGRQLVQELAHRISLAQRRVRICSPVLTSGTILGTLADLVLRPGLDIAGAFDATQMSAVLKQWSEDERSGWKAAAFEAVLKAAPFAGKHSIPYSPGSVHNFMHAKVTVVDDTVFAGSYNLSNSGEENAENVLEMEHAGLADLFAGFVDEVRRRYRVSELD